MPINAYAGIKYSDKFLTTTIYPGNTSEGACGLLAILKYDSINSWETSWNCNICLSSSKIKAKGFPTDWRQTNILPRTLSWKD